MKLVITLEGPAAPQIVRSIARSYALLHIRTRLTDANGTVNAPWSDVARQHGTSIAAAHRRWMRIAERERLSYRAALESILGDRLPAPPEIDWPASQHAVGKIVYSAIRATECAAQYAETVVWMALNQDAAPAAEGAAS